MGRAVAVGLWPSGIEALAQPLQQRRGRPVRVPKQRPVERIERVLDHQPEFGVALQRQAAVEKQRVRVV